MIRPATEADFPDIVRMGRKFWALTEFRDVPYCPDSILFTTRQMLQQGLLFIAEHEACVIGAIGAVLIPLYGNRDVLMAGELYWWIEPEHRSGGAGRELLAAIEAAAKARGASHFSMVALESVEPDKVSALYRKLGYVPSERTFLKRL